MKDISTMTLVAICERIDEIHDQIGESICTIADGPTAMARIGQLASERERLMEELARRATKQSAVE